MPPSARLPWDAALQGHFPGWAAPPAALPIFMGTCTLKQEKLCGESWGVPLVFVTWEKNALKSFGNAQCSHSISGCACKGHHPALLIKPPSPDFLSSEEMSWAVASSFDEALIQHNFYIFK